MIATTYGLGFKVQQSDFQGLIFYYIPSFIAYIFIFHFVKEKANIWSFVGLGILLRFILIFSFPNLSDDIYRFIWDGRLVINGINPFNYLPSYFIENQVTIPGITAALFDKLNSPNYYTIYPPICQGIFTVACWFFPNSLIGSAAVMKVFMFAFECGSIFLIIKLLEHFKLPPKNVLLYTLNPLVLVEIMGNLHFEGAMIFFLLLALWFLIKNQLSLSAVAIAFSIASKLLPLIFLPFLIRRLGWKKGIQYFGIVGITILVLFFPLLNGIFIQNFGESLDLYFQKFEFNASIYYVLRWLFELITGYNQIETIGPLLGLFVLTGVIIYTLKEQIPDFKNLFKAMLFGICLYLFLATTIHPWYVFLPLVFSIFTRFRFPVVWSALIILTYINYSYSEYYENLWIVGLEYAIVFAVLFWELYKFKPERLIES
jgi:hypothetical protein